MPTRWRHSRVCRPALSAVAALALLALPSAAAAAPEPGDYGENDYGGFRDVNPPGTNGLATIGDIAAFRLTGNRPPHNDDQLDMYADLVQGAPGLTQADIGTYFKDATFGVRPPDREREYSPRDDVTIVRDEFGVPRIYGEGRAGAMFGAGYIAAEDRLFFIDVLRHAGRAQLSSFAGGANTQMDRDVWADTPYNEQELDLQYQLGDEAYGSEGRMLQQDVTEYVAGVNAYIAEARVTPSKMPGEYAAINRPQGPEDWKVSDVISIASLVAGIFGKGGGGELGAAVFRQTAIERYGRRKGLRVYRDFRAANDPEAPTTVANARFPYQRVPKRTPGKAMPDRGSLVREPVVVGEESEAAARSSQPGMLDGLLDGVAKLEGGSNALLVSGRESKSGTPLAVFGPQVSYFTPQILMEMEIHAPGGPEGPPLDARGTSFPGTNLYVQLGHGRDYSWSATSAGQDIIDVFALRLCEPGGGKASLDSGGYRYRGECKPFDVLERENSWTPSAADQTEPGSETLRTLRTDLGVVTHRATIDGRPHVYTKLRSTYFHEVDSALGFADFNNPRRMESPREFMRAACRIDYTFNWFYIDDRKIAYFNSGNNPVRSKLTHPDFPSFGKRRFEWRDFRPPGDLLRNPDIDPDDVDPRINLSDQEPCSTRPKVVDQRFLSSWNNKQARGYRSSGFGDFTSIYRVDSLDERIRAGIRGPRKLTLPKLITAMQAAGNVDLRGAQVLPWALRVLRSRPLGNADVRAAVSTLGAWTRSGAYRRDLDSNGTYEATEAVRIMDAWWPRMVEGNFRRALGGDLFAQALGDNDDEPRAQGSAYQEGAYGTVEKDLRNVLGRNVKGRYSRVYCGAGRRGGGGGGNLGKCRRALLDSLKEALEVSYGELYGSDTCENNAGVTGDPQYCNDAVRFRALGGITQPPIHWINRPTYQQVVEIQGHR